MGQLGGANKRRHNSRSHKTTGRHTGFHCRAARKAPRLCRWGQSQRAPSPFTAAAVPEIQIRPEIGCLSCAQRLEGKQRRAVSSNASAKHMAQQRGLGGGLGWSH